MAKAAKHLPENIDALKSLVLVKEEELLDKDQRIAVLEEKLRLALMKRFAACSEKTPGDQLNLFNEAEAIVETPAAQETETTIGCQSALNNERCLGPR